MDIKTDDTTQGTSLHTVQEHARISFFRTTTLFEGVLVLVLTLLAFIPRLVLATQLDMVTDEVVYIIGGKIYLQLLTHLQINSSLWHYNYEHPPFVKLLIGLVLQINSALGYPLPDLLASRLPSIVMGTVLVIAVYLLARDPFGRVIALGAALCLAVSPWLVYFSALAYLDMTMTALITIAYLLTWHATRRPWLYLVVALLVGLATDSKYTAVLAIPAIVLFTAYYFFLVRRSQPLEQRPPIPWLWWLATIVLAPLLFFCADPAIWPSPLTRLQNSFEFEWNHSQNGHLTFLAGQIYLHVPQWAILYIMIAKMSAFVTVPAVIFAVLGLVQLVRFHLGKISAEEAARIAFVWIWLISVIAMFSLLNIVVGTHYHIPMAAPVALAGAVGLAYILRYQAGSLWAQWEQWTLFSSERASISATQEVEQAPMLSRQRRTFRVYPLIASGILLLALFVPHLIGLVTVYGAEGYTSEFFPNENHVLQVAYPGYRDGVEWIAAHTNGQEEVGLTALQGTLDGGSDGVSWYNFNSDLPARLDLSEAHPDSTYEQYNYLVWPMDLVQRGFPLPKSWRVIHTILGGSTVYCYILVPQASR